VKVPSPIARKLRCAVYTRKSTEEGLEQEFNSLDAQREACEAYIASQRAEGWVLVPDHYDDGGVSGATLERPALRRLLAEIEASKVDVVVVYKIDRLSRALMDFAKLVEVFRPQRRHLRQRHPVVQHDDVHGPAYAQHSSLLCAV
jgi:site-specific DNA recombinase